MKKISSPTSPTNKTLPSRAAFYKSGPVAEKSPEQLEAERKRDAEYRAIPYFHK